MVKVKYCSGKSTYDLMLPASPTWHESARPPHFRLNILIKPDSCLHTTYSIFITAFEQYFLALAPFHSYNRGVWSSYMEESHFYIQLLVDLIICVMPFGAALSICSEENFEVFSYFFCWVPKVVLDPNRPSRNKRKKDPPRLPLRRLFKPFLCD